MTATVTERPGPPPRGPRRSIKGIFTRYTAGSVLAAVASEVTLLATHGPGLLGPGAASVAAWAAGAALNYVLNRYWAWGRRGRAPVLRELLPYWAIAVAGLLVAIWATGVADRLGTRWFDGGPWATLFVGATFLGVYGLMFIVKFVLFHYFVFARGDDDAPRRGERRSRSQVPSTTRE